MTLVPCAQFVVTKDKGLKFYTLVEFIACDDALSALQLTRGLHIGQVYIPLADLIFECNQA